jgi:hypothetical protein
MLRRRRVVWGLFSTVLIFGLLVVGEARAQSKPEAGAAVSGFKVAAVTGACEGKEVTLADKPEKAARVYLFVAADKWDRPIARYLRTLDGELVKGISGADGAEATAVWLTDDKEQSKEYLPRAQQSLQFSKTALAVFLGDKQGPEGWNLDEGAHLTTVIVRDGKVAASFAYRSTNETDVPEVVKALGK